MKEFEVWIGQQVKRGGIKRAPFFTENISVESFLLILTDKKTLYFWIFHSNRSWNAPGVYYFLNYFQELRMRKTKTEMKRLWFHFEIKRTMVKVKPLRYRFSYRPRCSLLTFIAMRFCNALLQFTFFNSFLQVYNHPNQASFFCLTRRINRRIPYRINRLFGINWQRKRERGRELEHGQGLQTFVFLRCSFPKATKICIRVPKSKTKTRRNAEWRQWEVKEW